MTLYGTFQGDPSASLVAAESVDGMHWKVRSIIADPKNCQDILKGGTLAKLASEPSLCRLADGRLMSVFRLQYHQVGFPCGQAWSDDEGKTWSRPIVIADNIFPVSPSLATMKNGTVVRSGGRPGLYAWFNADGTGRDWERVDMMAHHNAFAPKDPMNEVLDDAPTSSSPGRYPEHAIASFRTSAYTEVVALDDTHLLYIYDRILYGWYPIPKGSPETNSVWVVRMTLRRK